MADPTASEIITFIESLEDKSATFYEKLADRFLNHREAFVSFAKESKRNKVHTVRTYRETISDALEACFSFKHLRLDNYRMNPILTENAKYNNALEKAIHFEENAIQFYCDATECSKPLMATLPRAFRDAAETRCNRKAKLESMLKGA